MLYYLIFLVLSIFTFLEIGIISKKRKIAIYVFFTVIFILLSGLRWRTGSDWPSYEFYYTNYNPDSLWFKIAMEPGFALFVEFLRLFSSDFTFYLLALAVTTISLKVFFFYRFTNAIFLALLLYWSHFLGDLTAIRQSLAMSICLISLIFVENKKPILFAAATFIAMQIHLTAFIFFISYPLYYSRWSVKSKCYLLLIALSLGLVGSSEFVLKVVSGLIPADAGNLFLISAKANHYLELGSEKTYGGGYSKTQQLLLGIFKRAIILPVFLWFQNKFDKSLDCERYQGFLNLFVFANIVYFLIADFLTIQRIVSYFYPLEIILICLIFEKVSFRKLWLSIFVLYSLVKLFYFVSSSSELIVPYYWVFSEDFYRSRL